MENVPTSLKIKSNVIFASSSVSVGNPCIVFNPVTALGYFLQRYSMFSQFFNIKIFLITFCILGDADSKEILIPTAPPSIIASIASLSSKSPLSAVGK